MSVSSLEIIIITDVKIHIKSLPITVSIISEDIFMECPINTYSWKRWERNFYKHGDLFLSLLTKRDKGNSLYKIDSPMTELTFLEVFFPKAQMQAHSAGTVKLARDHWLSTYCPMTGPTFPTRAKLKWNPLSQSNVLWCFFKTI